MTKEYNEQTNTDQNMPEQVTPALPEQNTAEQNTAEKPRTGGSFFERRYRLYDKIKLSVKTLDIIIATAVILLLVVFILGVYKR